MEHADDKLFLKRADILSRMSDSVDRMYNDTPGVFYGKPVDKQGWHYLGLGMPPDTEAMNEARQDFLDCIMPRALFIEYAALYFDENLHLSQVAKVFPRAHGGHPSKAVDKTSMYGDFCDSADSVLGKKRRLIRVRDQHPMNDKEISDALYYAERYPSIEKSFHVMLDIMRHYRRDFSALSEEGGGGDHKLIQLRTKADEVFGVAENNEFFHVGVLMASASEGVRQAAEEGRMDLTGEDLSQGMRRWIYGDNSAFATHRMGMVNICPFKARFVELWNKHFLDDGSYEAQRGGFFDTVTERLETERDMILGHEHNSDEPRT